MPNGIKYITGTLPSGFLRRGNMAIANGTADYGSTVYTAISPSTGGYTIYQNKATGGPSIYTPANDADLVKITNYQVAGSMASPAGYTGATACLVYYASQIDKICFNMDYPPVVANGLVLNIDSEFTPSYPRGGTGWFDLSGNEYTTTLINGPTYLDNGYFNFDNTNDYAQISSILNLDTLAATRNITFCFTVKKVYYSTGGNSTGDSMILIGVTNGYNSGFRLTNNNTGTPGTLFSGTPTFTFGAPAINNQAGVTSPRTGQNTFCHVCFTQSGSSVTGFINGAFNSTTFTNPYVSGSNSGSIGRDQGFGVGWFGGYLSDFKIYNRALTQAEILQNYYKGSIVTSGLVYSVDAGNLPSYEPGTTGAYSLVGDYPGALINGVGYSNFNGGIWSFDGVDDYVNCGNTIFPAGTQNFTISIWVYLKDAVVGDYIFSKGSAAGGAGGGGFWLVNGTNYVRFQATDSTPTRSTALDISGVSLNTWYNFTYTYDGTTITGYKNAASPVTNTSISGPINYVSDPILIGTHRYLGNFPTMNVSSFSLYNRALTASEVLQNYNSQKYRFGL